MNNILYLKIKTGRSYAGIEPDRNVAVDLDEWPTETSLSKIAELIARALRMHDIPVVRVYWKQGDQDWSVVRSTTEG